MLDNEVFLEVEKDVDGAAHLARGPVPGLSFRMIALEVWPESDWPGFALRQADVLQPY